MIPAARITIGRGVSMDAADVVVVAVNFSVVIVNSVVVVVVVVVGKGSREWSRSHGYVWVC